MLDALLLDPLGHLLGGHPSELLFREDVDDRLKERVVESLDLAC